MRKQTGFTLIELVIVIIILGILGAVATPRLMSLINNSYQTNIERLYQSVQQAATISHLRAQRYHYVNLGFAIADKDTLKLADNLPEAQQVRFKFGYPEASGNGIIKMLDRDNDFSSEQDGSLYTYTHTDTSYTILRMAMRARGYRENDAEKCEVQYQTPKQAGQAAKITLFTQGC